MITLHFSSRVMILPSCVPSCGCLVVVSLMLYPLLPLYWGRVVEEVYSGEQWVNSGRLLVKVAPLLNCVSTLQAIDSFLITSDTPYVMCALECCGVFITFLA